MYLNTSYFLKKRLNSMIASLHLGVDRCDILVRWIAAIIAQQLAKWFHDFMDNFLS